ncbi:MAG: hypothetical protein M3373_14330 [Gemmatimonadota bacterium]|nr:hypothetical protein [Gemmatimonadota bacterium]
MLFTDYSGFRTWEQWHALIEAEHRLMPREPLGSVRALAVFTDSRFSTDVFEALKELAVANKPHMKASALVGLSPLQRTIFLKGIEDTSSRAFGLFDTVEEALDWLVEQE